MQYVSAAQTYVLVKRSVRVLNSNYRLDRCCPMLSPAIRPLLLPSCPRLGLVLSAEVNSSSQLVTAPLQPTYLLGITRMAEHEGDPYYHFSGGFSYDHRYPHPAYASRATLCPPAWA